MQYKHCEIANRYKTINRENPISGHEWVEHENATGYRVHGGKLMEREYRTLEKAKAAIDFDWELQFGKFSQLKTS